MNRPDRSNEEVSLDVLADIFPQLTPIARLFRGGKTAYTRRTAPIGIAIQLAAAAAAACIFMVLVWISSKFNISVSQKGNPLVVFFALPAMFVILVSLNNAFDLFYLFLTGIRSADGGPDATVIRVVLLVMGFVGSLFGAGYAFFAIETFSGDMAEQARLREEQKTYFSHLNKGREAWNAFITATPMHRIDFSYADLSRRTFKGFFFTFVRFDHANLTDTVFEDCMLQSAYFDDATCLRTKFKDSYLSLADFIRTDLTGARLEGAYGEAADFKQARIDPGELKNLRPPASSHWHNTSWQDFHPPEWLRARGYFVPDKPMTGKHK